MFNNSNKNLYLIPRISALLQCDILLYCNYLISIIRSLFPIIWIFPKSESLYTTYEWDDPSISIFKFLYWLHNEVLNWFSYSKNFNNLLCLILYPPEVFLRCTTWNRTWMCHRPVGKACSSSVNELQIISCCANDDDNKSEAYYTGKDKWWCFNFRLSKLFLFFIFCGYIFVNFSFAYLNFWRLVSRI